MAVVKAIRYAAIALDPCRGWGRHPLARIRAQKEPVVSPVGAGTEYHSTRTVSWSLVLLSGQGTRGPFIATLSRSTCPGIRTLDESAFPSTQRNTGDGHALQKEWRAGFPAGARGAHRPWSIRWGAGSVSYFEICRGLREGLRLALACRPFSMGRVPLQSG